MSAPSDACRCGHWLASHKPIEDSRGGTCYDPETDCRCRGFTAELPWRRK